MGAKKTKRRKNKEKQRNNGNERRKINIFVVAKRSGFFSFDVGQVVDARKKKKKKLDGSQNRPMFLSERNPAHSFPGVGDDFLLINTGVQSPYHCTSYLFGAENRLVILDHM